MRWIIGAMIVLSLVVGGAVIFGTSNQHVRDADPRAVMIPVTRDAPLGMKEYRNAQYRFSLFIPESMDVYTTSEGQGATTFSFEDGAAGQGFQIFVLPYLEEQVSEERFRTDIPSGIRRDMNDITIDGTTGASFFSEHAILGETAEVWFVQNGHLYEVTTLKPLAEWLSGILQTWEFIR